MYSGISGDEVEGGTYRLEEVRTRTLDKPIGEDNWHRPAGEHFKIESSEHGNYDILSNRFATPKMETKKLQLKSTIPHFVTINEMPLISEPAEKAMPKVKSSEDYDDVVTHHHTLSGEDSKKLQQPVDISHQVVNKKQALLLEPPVPAVAIKRNYSGRRDKRIEVQPNFSYCACDPTA